MKLFFLLGMVALREAMEHVWTWIMRGCGVAGYAYLLIRHGLDAPLVFYVLLAGLIFGPDMIAGQFRARMPPIVLAKPKTEKEPDDGDKA